MSLSLAVRTGLEPATPGVTGPYSNQLNYRTRLFKFRCRRRTFVPHFLIADAKIRKKSQSPNFSLLF